MKFLEGLDKLGLFLYVFICSFAVANIYSVDPGLGSKQALYFGVSIFVGLIIFAMRTKFFENLAGVFYIGGILLLLGLFPFGTEILGQKNWYKFGGMTMQPVEFAKIGTALMLANYVSGGDFDLKNRKSLITSFAILGIPALVVLMIPDVGSVLVFAAFVIALFREGLNGKIFGIVLVIGGIFLLSNYLNDPVKANPWYFVGAILFIGLLYILLNIYQLRINVGKLLLTIGTIVLLGIFSYVSPLVFEKLPKHQKERIEVLYKGEREFRDTSGYNLLYSKTAIGSGGFFGKGYQQGSVTQGKFVPEQETDYIFCTVGEEWGFFGSSILVLCYAIFIGRIYYLSELQKSVFNRVFGYSFASILLIHFTINLGMIMGLFPTVGIPLPFFSYGGSSLLAFSIMTFIFFKLNYSDRNSLV